jgi:hypothetical protein
MDKCPKCGSLMREYRTDLPIDLFPTGAGFMWHGIDSKACLQNQLRAVSEHLAIAQRAMEIRQTWHYSEYNVWLKERFEQIDIVNAAADCDLMTLAFAIAESEAEGESR